MARLDFKPNMKTIKPEMLPWSDPSHDDAQDAHAAAEYLNSFTFEDALSFIDRSGEWNASALMEDIANNAPASDEIASEFAVIAGEKWGCM